MIDTRAGMNAGTMPWEIATTYRAWEWPLATAAGFRGYDDRKDEMTIAEFLEMELAASDGVDQTEISDKVLEIFRRIASGEDKHGDFLTCFSEAVIRADEANFALILTASLALIGKYKLGQL